MWKREKTGMQSRVARFRVPGAPEPAGAPGERQAANPSDHERPMPLAASILWKPIDGAATEGPGLLPIFIAQRALGAMHDHCAAVREACFGLLIGNLFRSPDTGAAYVIVESTIRLPAGSGDDAKSALLQAWVVAQDVVRRTGDRLIGWYRGQWSAEARLTPVEAEIHAAMFAEPWQVAVAVGSGDATVGGVFRRSASSEWAQECLPFYELVDPASFPRDGGKPTRLCWDNYRTEETALVPSVALTVPVASTVLAPLPAPPTPPAPLAPPASPAPAPRSPVPPRVLLPDEFGAAEGAQALEAAPPGAQLRRATRWAVYTTVGLLTVGGLFRLYSALAAPAAPGPSGGAPEAIAGTPPARLDRAADTLALALAAFDLRAQLFASRQMQCPELARGLVLVEERWTAYNGVRKDVVVLDSARSLRDRALYADVDGVERRFERAACPRP